MIHVTHLLNQYGYIVLLCSMILELIALPLPGEILMTYCGFLIYQGHLHYIFSLLFTMAGVMIGITTSYFLGRVLGKTFFYKYGSKVHLGPQQINKTSMWFEKYGNWLLMIAYFIPGVRHVTGYFSGIINLPYKKFAVKAYTGAIIWVITFVTLGKVLGQNWNKFHHYIIRYGIIVGCALVVIVLGVYIYKKKINKQISE